MSRVLLVPAAGTGSRLGSAQPKLLTPVAGRSMIEHIIERHRHGLRALILVVQPAHEALVQAHLSDDIGFPVELAVQVQPTGMLDAVIAGRNAALAHGTERIWITWCDQVGISSSTVQTLDQMDLAHPDDAVIMPVVRQPSPYIHFERDATGRLSAVRHRREGDEMPAIGTSDAGLFSLSHHALERCLPAYAGAPVTGARTGERNFLPFLPWLASQAAVRTFDIPAEEAQGINTPQDLADVERRLQAAARQRS